MQQSQKQNEYWQKIQQGLRELMRRHPDPDSSLKKLLFITGIILTPITLAGALWGYRWSYMRIMFPEDREPDLHDLPFLVRLAMVLGAILIWLLPIITVVIVILLIFLFMDSYKAATITPLVFAYLLINTVATFFIMQTFETWRNGYFNLFLEKRRFGTSDWAKPDELKEYINTPEKNQGLYIGDAYAFHRLGHLLTCAGTRGGKGINLIIPNLLGKGGYNGSWVIIDPKGENAAITARFQEQQGKKVIILNPWHMHFHELGTNSYNPLDLLIGGDPMNLADDVNMISEMIVPFTPKNADEFFSNRARSLINGLLLYMVIQKEEPKTLTTLWQWLRLPEPTFKEILDKMVTNEDPINGKIIRNTANEIASIRSSERTYASVIATAQQYTDFLKSPSLQKYTEQSDFEVGNLSDGNTVLYIIIPTDKLKSQAKWLRLVVSTTMRAVVRNPNKRVTFLLDEFAALGYISEIETALSTYAGYGITVWPIIQSLIQLKNEYGENWETFLGNTNVQHFFSLGDNFTAEYASKLFGTTTYVTFSKSSVFGVTTPKATQRLLITEDELRRGSVDNIFTIIDKAYYINFPKRPYMDMPELAGRYDPNPFFKDDGGEGKVGQATRNK